MKEVSKTSSYYTNKVSSQKVNYSLSINSRKKKMPKPPFKKGLYSYKQSYSYVQNINSINNNNFFSYEPPNYSLFNIKKDKNRILNILPIEANSSLSFSSLNLNKYKINNIPEKKNKSGLINTNILSNNKSNMNNSLNNSNIIEYYNYFNDCRKYEKESRRMLIELLKLNLGKKNNINNNNITGIKQLMKDNKISLKVLNQKLTQKEYENEVNNNSNFSTINNKEVFGEAKKFVYLKNLDNYVSQNSTITTEIITTNNNRLFNIENSIRNNNNKKKINILNFLLTPRVLNLIEDMGEKQKFVFLISLEDNFYLEGKESYVFIWKNMENNEVENEFNIKKIIKCEENKIFRNRFGIKVINKEFGEEFNYEIETPSDEICNDYVIGINYLLSK